MERRGPQVVPPKACLSKSFYSGNLRDWGVWHFFGDIAPDGTTKYLSTEGLETI